jgi:hypothetical protein
MCSCKGAIALGKGQREPEIERLSTNGSWGWIPALVVSLVTWQSEALNLGTD